jgi:hypothetical protein
VAKLPGWPVSHGQRQKHGVRDITSTQRQAIQIKYKFTPKMVLVDEVRFLRAQATKKALLALAAPSFCGGIY